MPIYVVDPRQPLEGCLTLVCNGDEAVTALKNIEQDLKARRFRARATVADVIPLIGDLDSLLGPGPFPNIVLIDRDKRPSGFVLPATFRKRNTVAR
jgi:hypothetical protein